MHQLLATYAYFIDIIFSIYYLIGGPLTFRKLHYYYSSVPDSAIKMPTCFDDFCKPAATNFNDLCQTCE